MLRITVQRHTRNTLLILEGRLAGAWVEELDKVLAAQSVVSRKVRVTINLSAVSGMDAAGKALLTESHARGVNLTGDGLAARAFVEEITGKNGIAEDNGNLRNLKLLP